jgi:nitrogen regulatory protein P-II 1
MRSPFGRPVCQQGLEKDSSWHPSYRKVTAIVRIEDLERVEKALQDLRVSGVTVTRVKGYGEYKDFFECDWLGAYARLELFTGEERVSRVVDAILSVASTGTAGDGIVSVLPVERVWRIRSRAPVPPEEL